MKIDTVNLLKPTTIASSIVILSSLAVGLGSGFFAFYLGSTSLVGVTSPAENPTQKINNQEKNDSTGKKFTLMSEQKMLVKVYDRIHKAREESKVKGKSTK